MDNPDRAILERKILEQAEQMVGRRVSAVEFSNRLFGPDGLLRTLWTTQSDRQGLVCSDLYRTLKTHLRALEKVDVVQFERDIADYSEVRGNNYDGAGRKEPEAA